MHSKSAQVLDVCCGGRLFWFDKQDTRTIFMDKRKETTNWNDSYVKTGVRVLTVAPDLQASFTDLPFADNLFPLVVFDPPHIIRAGKNSMLTKKYGKLEQNWHKELRKGFDECFRVLKPQGILVFKWSEYQIPVSEVLQCTTEKPLFGHRSGKASKTHWLTFIKSAADTIEQRQHSMFTHEQEMLVALDDFLYKCKGVPSSQLRNQLISKVNQFLHENKLDTDQHNFVTLSCLLKKATNRVKV